MPISLSGSFLPSVYLWMVDNPLKSTPHDPFLPTIGHHAKKENRNAITRMSTLPIFCIPERQRLFLLSPPMWSFLQVVLMMMMQSSYSFSFLPTSLRRASSTTSLLSHHMMPSRTTTTTVAFLGRTTTLPLWANLGNYNNYNNNNYNNDEDDDVLMEEEYNDEEEYDDEEDEEEYDDEDEDEEEEDSQLVYELQDDFSDPNYMRQKELVEASIKAREQQMEDENFDALDYCMEQLTPSQVEVMENLPLINEINAKTNHMLLTEQDLSGISLASLNQQEAKVGDLMDDPYPIYENPDENLLEQDVGVTNEDMLNLQEAWNITQKAVRMLDDPWDRVMAKDEMSDDEWMSSLDNQTLQEMEDCLEEIGGSAYNVTRWLLYDLDFNVTNLMLAAIKHNRRAPILFQHWYPQLLTYSRYQSACDRNFDFTWTDVENADVSELERYYKGMGYDEIPKKTPGETGIITLEELDEEEIRMAAFENWMTDVYNPEWDRYDFDSDEMRDEDNVFSPYFEAPQHPDLPTYEDVQLDLEEWDEEMGDDDDDRDFKHYMGRDYKYNVIQDEEFDKEFRGHLVVACTADDSDLMVAETITARMFQEFGSKVFVETRVIAHAREEDNVFEVWLESYEIDLLHSKKRASLNTKGWDGPAECDDEQIEWLVDKVGFLISDDSRYSYRYEMANVE